MRRRTREEVITDLRLGLGFGFFCASCLSLFVGVTQGVGEIRIASSYRAPFWQIVVVYFLCAAFGGLVFGLFRPVTRQLGGRLFMSVIIATFINVSSSVLVNAALSWRARWGWSFVAALVFGPLYMLSLTLPRTRERK